MARSTFWPALAPYLRDDFFFAAIDGSFLPIGVMQFVRHRVAARGLGARARAQGPADRALPEDGAHAVAR
jgi:hypothetical protein